MQTVTSVSGGRTSAYLAANYPADALVFALVRIEDQMCKFPDEKIRQMVEDRIQAPFIATAEDDMIIYTMFNLEQFLGRKIDWVTGLTYETVIREKGGWLPNVLHRYCTTYLKFIPIVNWWATRFGISNPIEMNIGYRANELSRANRMKEKLNERGFVSAEVTIEKRADGRNKWITVDFEKPRMPLIEDGILKSHIANYWRDKSVPFADYNNCVGCFHREPIFLRYMFQQHPEKMNWFKRQEGRHQDGKMKGFWRSDGSYERFEKLMAQLRLYPDDFSECDSGYCEIS